MGAGDRPKNSDQHHQNGAGRDGVAEQGQCNIVGEPVGHDARTDDGGDQHRGAEGFGGKTAGQIDGHPQPALGRSRPISSSRFCKANLSTVLIGRLTKIEMRLLSMR